MPKQVKIRKLLDEEKLGELSDKTRNLSEVSPYRMIVKKFQDQCIATCAVNLERISPVVFYLHQTPVFLPPSDTS